MVTKSVLAASTQEQEIPAEKYRTVSSDQGNDTVTVGSGQWSTVIMAFTTKKHSEHGRRQKLIPGVFLSFRPSSSLPFLPLFSFLLRLPQKLVSLLWGSAVSYPSGVQRAAKTMFTYLEPESKRIWWQGFRFIPKFAVA